ncbi:MAG: glycoside hydrolase family 71/99-like protein [Limisphaera sp.]
MRVFRCGLASMLLHVSPLSAGEKLLLAHYMPWYTAPPISSQWGWHWTMGHFNPDQQDAEGRRQIASWYYPLTGPYDSADPVVLEYQVLLMKLAGIDGVIADWYGKDDFLDYGLIHQRTLRLFEWTRRAGLVFCLCYEDRTIARMIGAGFLPSSQAVTHARETLREAERLFFSDPGYLRWNGRPVLLNFGPVYFTADQWPAIFAGLQPTNQPVFFTLDRRVTGAAGAFNWPPMWASSTNDGRLSMATLQSYLDGFEQKALSWSLYISSAFPRFHDIYAEAGVGPSYGRLEDADGEVFRATLHRALTNRSTYVQLVTWNDYGEGTILEPTREFGFRDLEIIQDARRSYLDPAFSRTSGDLTLAWRLYQLRRRFAGQPLAEVELDHVFSLVKDGELASAGRLLEAMEVQRPVLHGWTLAGESLEFQVGGWRGPAGLEIQCSTNPFTGPWATVAVLPAETNRAVFRAAIDRAGPPRFYRARNR